VARLVLTDASPLIGLSIVSGLPWLQSLFGQIWMPAEVEVEVLSGQVPRGGADLRAALTAGWLQTWTGPRVDTELPQLDEGESACIRIVLAHPATTLLLIDERAGRAVAAEHGIKIAGTAAVIGLARQRGLITSAKPVFAALHGSDFRISADVVRAVLARVGEA
jgi:predicted nucleic acid-binding protein